MRSLENVQLSCYIYLMKMETSITDADRGQTSPILGICTIPEPENDGRRNRMASGVSKFPMLRMPVNH
jgi:hypothetical protein